MLLFTPNLYSKLYIFPMSQYYHFIFILYIVLFSKIFIIFLYIFHNLILFVLSFSFIQNNFFYNKFRSAIPNAILFLIHMIKYKLDIFHYRKNIKPFHISISERYKKIRGGKITAKQKRSGMIDIKKTKIKYKSL